jgi:hypothetical protein
MDSTFGERFDSISTPTVTLGHLQCGQKQNIQKYYSFHLEFHISDLSTLLQLIIMCFSKNKCTPLLKLVTITVVVLIKELVMHKMKYQTTFKAKNNH